MLQDILFFDSLRPRSTDPFGIVCRFLPVPFILQSVPLLLPVNYLSGTINLIMIQVNIFRQNLLSKGIEPLNSFSLFSLFSKSFT